MTALVELDRDALSGFAAEPSLPASRWPVDMPVFPFAAEATNIALGLVALVGEQEIAEAWLHLSARIAVDTTINLFTADAEALSGWVVFDPGAKRMHLELGFSAAGKSAAAAARVARFLSTLHRADALAFRLPDGGLSPERTEVPKSLVVDQGLVRLLDLLADVARLSRTDVPVPPSFDAELINDLLVARRLLQGQDVEGTWSTGEVRLRPEARELLNTELLKGEPHQLMTVSEMRLDIFGTQVPLGEIRQVFSNASVESLVEENGELVLRLRAAPDKAPSVMSPITAAPLSFEPDLQISEDAFLQLLADLDAAPRVNPLRDQL